MHCRSLQLRATEVLQGGTNIDDVLIVADEQVAEDAGFVEVAQTDHVLHPVDGGRVHGLDVGGILRGYPVFLGEGGEKKKGLK